MNWPVKYNTFKGNKWYTNTVKIDLRLMSTNHFALEIYDVKSISGDIIVTSGSVFTSLETASRVATYTCAKEITFPPENLSSALKNVAGKFNVKRNSRGICTYDHLLFFSLPLAPSFSLLLPLAYLHA